MRTLGNILWFIFVGWWSFLLYGFSGVLMCITIIGIPIGKALFQYAKLMTFPFGKVIVKETFIKGKENVSAVRRVFGTIANILWLPAGIILFIGNIGLIIGSAITIIGIPYAIVLAKSCVFLLWPVGAKVITKEEYAVINNGKIAARYGVQNGTQNPMPAVVQSRVEAVNSIPAERQNSGQSVITGSGAQTMSAVNSVDKGAAFKDNMTQLTGAVTTGLAGAGVALKNTGEKVSASAQQYAGQTGNYLKDIYRTNNEMAEKQDMNLTWSCVMQQVEAALFRNPYVAGVLTFLPAIFGVYTFLYFLFAMIAMIDMIRYRSILIELFHSGFFFYSIEGIASGAAVYALFGVLFTIRRKYVWATICFFLPAVVLFVLAVCTIFILGFSSGVLLTLFGVISLALFGVITLLLRGDK